MNVGEMFIFLYVHLQIVLLAINWSNSLPKMLSIFKEMKYSDWIQQQGSLVSTYAPLDSSNHQCGNKRRGYCCRTVHSVGHVENLAINVPFGFTISEDGRLNIVVGQSSVGHVAKLEGSLLTLAIQILALRTPSAIRQNNCC